MSEQGKCFFLHVLWTVFLVANCGVKYIWYYDWSSTQDWLSTLLVIGLYLLELVIFLKHKETKQKNADANKKLLLYDVFLSASLVLFPFLLGNPTADYIVWNMIVPIVLLFTAALIRRRITSDDSV